MVILLIFPRDISTNQFVNSHANKAIGRATGWFRDNLNWYGYFSNLFDSISAGRFFSCRITLFLIDKLIISIILLAYISRLEK